MRKMGMGMDMDMDMDVGLWEVKEETYTTRGKRERDKRRIHVGVHACIQYPCWAVGCYLWLLLKVRSG